MFSTFTTTCELRMLNFCVEHAFNEFFKVTKKKINTSILGKLISYFSIVVQICINHHHTVVCTTCVNINTGLHCGICDTSTYILIEDALTWFYKIVCIVQLCCFHRIISYCNPHHFNILLNKLFYINFSCLLWILINRWIFL